MKRMKTSAPNTDPKKRIAMIEIVTNIVGIFSSPNIFVLARAKPELISDATQ